jgi:hypothetical protein
LKCLCGVALSEGHERELENAEWSGNDRLLYIIRMDVEFVVRSHQLDLGVVGTSEKLVGVIVDMTDRVAAWDCPCVECPVVPARAPIVVFLGYDV